MKEARVWGLEW